SELSCQLIVDIQRPRLCPYTTLFRSANSEAVALAARWQSVARIAESAFAIAEEQLVDPIVLCDEHHVGVAVAVEVRAQDMLGVIDRKSTRLNSSHVKISYADFCLKNT